MAGAVTVSGLGPLLWATAGPAWAFTAPVKIAEGSGGDQQFNFSPTVVVIDVDDKVLWTNKSQKRHTVTSSAGNGSFDSGQIPPGGQWERRFTVAGTYTYHCEVHPEMVGRIEVGPPPTTTTTTTPPPAPPAPTTTTAPPAPTTTAPTTTTTAAPRSPAGPPPQPVPPVPSSAAAPPPTLATSSTTTVPSTTTTTAAPPTTVTSAPPAPPAEGEAAPAGPAPETPPSTGEAPPAGDDGGDEMPAAAGPRRGSSGVDAATAAMVSALVAVGAFAAWTLIRVRPGRI